jgi:hypothetical protein
MKKLFATFLCLAALASCSPAPTPTDIRRMSATVNADDTLTPQFTWTDTRPIIRLVVGEYSHTSPNNLAGWLFDLYPGATRIEQMRTYAAQAIDVAKTVNAQGVIVWDIEGWILQNKSGRNEYIGSPDLAAVVNDGYRDWFVEFFSLFRAAGLKVGVCIRPIDVDPATGKFTPAADPYDNLLRKARFARTVWKCRLIYIDSSVDAFGNPLPATIFARLHKALPDVLFIPENETREYYLWTRPYLALENGEADVPADVRRDIPAAGAVIEVNSGDIDANRPALINAVKRGGILLVDGWFANPRNQAAGEIWRAAQAN